MEDQKKSIDKLKDESVNAESIKGGGGGYIPMANMNPGGVEEGGVDGMQMENNFNPNAVENGPFHDIDNTIVLPNTGAVKHPDSLGDN